MDIIRLFLELELHVHHKCLSTFTRNWWREKARAVPNLDSTVRTVRTVDVNGAREVPAET